jgi:hypothetical protein
MITFKNILKEYKIKSRSSEIDFKNDKTLNEIIYEYTGNESIYKRTSIWRGKAKDTRDILFIKPSSFERISANATSNYYTLLIDNSKYWKEYPKRSKSIMCTINWENAKSYIAFQTMDEPYQVIPKLNAKIAVCPRGDFWWSFINGIEIMQNNLDKWYIGRSLDAFNDCLRTQLILSNENSFASLKKAIDTKYKLSYEEMQNIKKYNCSTLYEFIDYCLNPELNGFKLMNYDDSFQIVGNNEVWTDSDSLMVKYLNQYMSK